MPLQCSTSADKKVCTKCKGSYDATTDNFYPTNRRLASGEIRIYLRNVCKNCDNLRKAALFQQNMKLKTFVNKRNEYSKAYHWAHRDEIVHRKREARRVK